LSLCNTISAQNGEGEAKIYISLEEARSALIGKKLPYFKVKLPDGSVLAQEDLSNKIVFINFWFAACSPCMAEMNGLNKLYDTLKNNKNVLFLSFTYDPTETANAVIEKYGIKYRVVNLSRDECHRLSGTGRYPTSVVINKLGVIKWAAVGGPVDEEIASGEIVPTILPEIMSELRCK
jgi:peroxiredoxin